MSGASFELTVHARPTRPTILTEPETGLQNQVWHVKHQVSIFTTLMGALANRYLARAVNHVSKIHDFFNSVNYSSGGLYLSHGAMFDSVFQLYSFAGMPVAGALTAAHYIGANPALLAGQLEARRQRRLDE